MNILYEIKNIGSKGQGIVCNQFIKKGEIVYILAKDTKTTTIEVNHLEAYLKTVGDVRDLLTHGFCSGEKFIDLQLCDARFTNHSFTPNCVYSVNEEVSIALRDISPGEEITENYWDYSLPESYDALMQKYAGGNYRDHAKTWA